MNKEKPNKNKTNKNRALHWSKRWGQMPSTDRGRQAELFGQAVLVQPRANALNHMERGLRNATTNLAELSEAVHDTRLMVGDALAALGGLSQQVETGFDTGQRTSDRILHVATQLRAEFRAARAEGKSPWEWLLYYWQTILRLTVFAWQISWSITRSAASSMTFPLCLCACGCYMLESVVLIMITDIGLAFGTCCISKYFGLSYHLFRMFIQLLQFFIFNVAGGMAHCTISYFRPYAEILSEETGVSAESIQAWRHDVTHALSDFIGSRVREEVREQVVPIVEELKNIPSDILNATSTAVSDTVANVVYAPKAAVNSVFGKGTGAALGVAASAVPQMAVNVAGEVAGLGSAALGKGAEYGAAALGVGKNVLGKASNFFTWSKPISEAEKLRLKEKEEASERMIRARLAELDEEYKKRGGGPINFLEGRELDEFNRTIGVHLDRLHDRLTVAFFNKYGKNTVLDKNASELVVFMEKSYDLLLHSILPWVANRFKHSRAIQVDPGLRKALILRAFCNVKSTQTAKTIMSKTSKMIKSKKSKTLRVN